MFIVMHCMGMPFNGATIDHESLGGSESAAYYVAKGLAAEGHNVTIFTNSQEEGTWEGVRYLFAGERNEQTPLGFNFQFYAMNTPHDVLIMQRDPTAFAHKYASKVNLWWVHDLALHRAKGIVQNHLWNIDAVLCVSQYHIDQICSVYSIDPKICYNIQNGVDLSLFTKPRPVNETKELIYSSRPERGLENLVKPGGIMHKLGSDHHLSVCAYENVTQEMAPYYEQLYTWAEQLPNVTLLGALSKQELADKMCTSDLLIYPTTFEEVSCITAMEAMAAGLPMLTSSHAALKETCAYSGTILLPLINGPAVDEDAFVAEAQAILSADAIKWRQLHAEQVKAAQAHTWASVVGRLLNCIEDNIQYSELSKIKHCLSVSDAVLLDEAEELRDPLSKYMMSKAEAAYDFTNNRDMAAHYSAIYKAFPETRNEETLQGNMRYETVASFLNDLNDGDTVLDYGCAHGHYTINLAQRFPSLKFVGYDIAEDNIQFAKAWADKLGLKNVTFERTYYDEGKAAFAWEQHFTSDTFALIICAEVLEHVMEPTIVLNKIMEFALQDATVVITTPYGPWESQQYQERYLLREHLFEFSRQDLHDMFGVMPNFDVKVVPSGHTKKGEVLGSYITSFSVPTIKLLGHTDAPKKWSTVKGEPTISLCMIAHNAETSIARAIESVINIVDEVIINIDMNSNIEETSNEIERLAIKYPLIRFDVQAAKSPLEVGFSAARNKTLTRANGDWILWIDTDEFVVNAENLCKYLKNNQYKGIALKQHHFSVEPLGVLKTDMPVKIFRNHCGIQFYGQVHEHPEKEMNKGVGHVWVVPDVEVVHDSYMTEEVRRERFARNFGLMQKDRRANPDRMLGKFLWLRDLTQSIKFELERREPVSESMLQRAREGIELWRELLDVNPRMASDGLEYYSSLVMLLRPQGAIDYEFSLQAQAATGVMDTTKAERFKGTFLTVEHAQDFFRAVEKAKVSELDSRYL